MASVLHSQSLVLVVVLLVMVVMAVVASNLTSVSFPFTPPPPPPPPEPRVQYDEDRPRQCGQKKVTSRIVGGQVTKENEYPWMAALTYSSDQLQFCGGSLINKRYVLTAAHCVYDLIPNQLTVRLAEHNLTTPDETDVVFRTVSKIIVHGSYDSTTQNNDIALLKLSSRVQITSTVMPVCLPPLTWRPKPDEVATVTGWGTTSSGGQVSDVLLEANVTVTDNESCNATYKGTITENMLCAHAPGKDACQGDSGGPLVQENDRGTYDQIGVVSWGYGCADPNYPGVYTRVNKYLPWIKKKTRNCCDCN